MMRARKNKNKIKKVFKGNKFLSPEPSLINQFFGRTSNQKWIKNLNLKSIKMGWKKN